MLCHWAINWEQYTGLFESQLYGLFKPVIENKQLIIEAGLLRDGREY